MLIQGLRKILYFYRGIEGTDFWDKKTQIGILKPREKGGEEDRTDNGLEHHRDLGCRGTTHRIR